MSSRILTRILEEPKWVELIRTLEPAVLARLIRHVGLEDSGEIVALATTEQLQKIFDEDLWRSDKPGQAETFDAGRFGTWLAVLLEAGTGFAAEKLAEMDEDFLTMAFARQIHVIDIDALAMSMSARRRGGSGLNEDDLLEKALESGLSQEFDGWLVVSRNSHTWDSVLTSLVALAEEDHDLFARLIERISHLSTETIEDNGGLYSVLSSEEQLDSEVAGERRDRRARVGFVDPDDARAFLKLARGPLEEKDWITPGYFKEFGGTATPSTDATSRPAGSKASLDRGHGGLLRLLQEAEVVPRDENPVLLSDSPGNKDPYHLIRGALRTLGGAEPALLGRRITELSYLSNTLIAGSSIAERAFRPAEAADAVLATCTLALDSAAPDLREVDMVSLFRAGMHLIHHELTRPLHQRFARELKLAEGLDSLIDVLEQLEIEELKALLEEVPRSEGRFLSTRSELGEAVIRARTLALKASGPQD